MSSLWRPQAKGEYLHGNSITGPFPAFSAEDKPPRPYQGARPRLTERPPAPPPPQRSSAGGEAPGGRYPDRGSARASPQRLRQARNRPARTPQGRPALGPGPAAAPWQRDAAAHGARRGGAAARPAPSPLPGAAGLRGPGPAGPQRGGSPAGHGCPRCRLPLPLTRAGLGLLQQRGAVLSLLGLHLTACRAAQRVQGQAASRHR